MDSDSILRLTRQLDPADERRQWARAARRGDHERVHRGAYADGHAWRSLSEREQYVNTVRAVAATRLSRRVVTYESAAVVHGLPLFRRPSRVHVGVPPGTGSGRRAELVTHSMRIADDDVEEIDGILVTRLDRTLIDLARIPDQYEALIPMADAVFIDPRGRERPRTSLDALREQWARMGAFTGRAAARRAIEVCTTGCQTPIETASTVSFRRLGLPIPQQQVPFTDATGLIGYADDYWPEFDAIGEADGDGKYLDAAQRSGRPVESVLLDEKRREDRLRRQVSGLARWSWRAAISPRLLAPILRAAGLPV